MADVKISSRTELAAAPANADELVIVDKSDTTGASTGTTKRITAENLRSGLVGQTEVDARIAAQVGLNINGQTLEIETDGSGMASVMLPSGGGESTVAGLALTLVGTSATLTTTAANIPKEGGGNLTRADISDVFLVDASYTRSPNDDLRVTGLVLLSDLDGTDEYRWQIQGAGGDYIALQFSAAGDTGILTAEDDGSSYSNAVVRIYNTEPAPTSGGGSVSFGDATEADTVSGAGGSSTDAARDDHSHAQSSLYGTIGYDDEGIFEWSGTDAGMVAQLRLDDTNSQGRFPTGAKRYFTHAQSVFSGKVARRNATAISHTSSTHTVADYFEVMDWGSASGGGGPTVTWLKPSAAQDATSNSRPAQTVWSVAADMRTALGNISSPSDGDMAFAYLLRTGTTDFALLWIYGDSRWQLVSESNIDSYRSGTIPVSGEGFLDGNGISVWDPDVIYPVNWLVIHDIAGHQGWQVYRKRTNTQTLATQPNPEVTQHWDRLTNDFGADRIPTAAAVPGSHAGSAYVQNWLDYFGADVPLHKAYWSTGVANNPFTAPDAFEALVSDLTQLGTLAHGDTLLIEITANIPSTATYHLNLQYKQVTGNSDTLTSENIRVVDGHQVIAFDIRYEDPTQTRGKLDIDGSVAGTGSGSVRVDSIVHFDGTLSGKDKETISSVVALVEERLLALDRFRGIWNSRAAYFVGQMVIHNMNLYICIRDVPARPVGTQANDGPRVSTDYWEAVSAFQGEWVSGNWYGEGNTFLYTLNADQYNEEQQLYLVVGRIDGTTASTAPPNNPNVVRIDTAGAIAQIADWAKTGNVSEIPASKLPQVQITRRNARMVVNYDGADVANEFQFPQASPTLDGAMAAADKEKLNTIQENAQRHIPTDWAAADGTPPAIRNKPALAPSNAQRNVQSDWDETDTASDAFIRNKPSGTGAQRTFPEIAAGLNALTGMDRVSYNQLRNKVPAATQSVDGTMSSVDKTKLDQLNQWTVESEWENDHDYVVGDIVVRMNAMARCIQAHTSVTGSSNDPAFSGVVNGFWELILHAVLETADTGFSRIILDYQGVTGSSREHNSVGMVYGGAWIAPTQQNTNQAYRWQNVRTHSGATYVCTEPHTATLTEPREPGTTGGAAYWDVLPGL